MARKKKPILSCEYCVEYNTAKARKNKGTERMCPTAGKEVHAEDNICEYFNPHTIVWCANKQKRMHIEVCLGHKRCQNCRQKPIMKLAVKTKKRRSLPKD